MTTALSYEWQHRANCIGLEPSWFFPERGADHRAAFAVCSGCEVVRECLTHALVRREQWGVFGRTTERQRRPLRRRMDRGVPVEVLVSETLAAPPPRTGGRPKPKPEHRCDDACGCDSLPELEHELRSLRASRIAAEQAPEHRNRRRRERRRQINVEITAKRAEIEQRRRENRV